MTAFVLSEVIVATRSIATVNAFAGKVTMRQVTTITDKDHYKLEFFNKGSDGKEFKSGEITATRKGAAKSDAAPTKTAEPAKKETSAPAKK